ncbi:MAG: D-2-hydroxyacid dehydrogenase [Chloroflexi bacterium]|nr:D-2-hydroxyacid dehydrogenase [Chloroflexota bacterium]
MKVIVPDFLVERLAPEIANVVPGAETVGISGDGEMQGSPVGAEVILRYFPNDRVLKAFGAPVIARLLREAPTLRWFQSHGVGVDGLLNEEIIASDLLLTNGASIHTVPMAEMTMALVLAATKRLPDHAFDQVERRWGRRPKRELRGSTVGIVGLGRIGEEVGRLCAAFGARVVGLRRTPTPEPPPGVERVYGPDGLDRLLAESDYVILALALNATSRGLLGRREIGLMKPTAILVNVARGDVVDEPALIDALREEQLGYACLDTFQKEPLPKDSPLYDLPNVFITPHNSASSPHMEARVIALFLDNLGRFVRGEPLLNVVDKQRGY